MTTPRGSSPGSASASTVDFAHEPQRSSRSGRIGAMSIESFERRPLLFGPSPTHPLPRLTEHLGGARVWAKREDCNSGIAFGGNKTRKLEYLVADALAQ